MRSRTPNSNATRGHVRENHVENAGPAYGYICDGPPGRKSSRKVDALAVERGGSVSSRGRAADQLRISCRLEEDQDDLQKIRRHGRSARDGDARGPHPVLSLQAASRPRRCWLLERQLSCSRATLEQSAAVLSNEIREDVKELVYDPQRELLRKLADPLHRCRGGRARPRAHARVRAGVVAVAPVQRIGSSAGRGGEGDFSHHVDVQNRDELGASGANSTG